MKRKWYNYVGLVILIISSFVGLYMMSGEFTGNYIYAWVFFGIGFWLNKMK